MPKDAKFGLVLGVGLVIAIGVVFFHKDPTAATAATDASTAAVSSPRPAQPPPPPAKTTPAKPARYKADRKHLVAEGDTLSALAQKYYGDRDKFEPIFHANQDVIVTPDRLVPGTELIIPELPRSGDKE